jgi:hypothetical protein
MQSRQLLQLLELDRDNLFVGAAADIAGRAIALSAVVNPILSSGTSSVQALFSGQTSSSNAQQLLAVAKLIERGARSASSARCLLAAVDRRQSICRDAGNVVRVARVGSRSRAAEASGDQSRVPRLGFRGSGAA